MTDPRDQEYLDKLEKIVKKAVKPDFENLNSRLDGFEGQLSDIQTKLNDLRKETC